MSCTCTCNYKVVVNVQWHRFSMCIESSWEDVHENGVITQGGRRDRSHCQGTVSDSCSIVLVHLVAISNNVI